MMKQSLPVHSTTYVGTGPLNAHFKAKGDDSGYLRAANGGAAPGKPRGPIKAPADLGAEDLTPKWVRHWVHRLCRWLKAQGLR
jgi:hypothetical protein